MSILSFTQTRGATPALPLASDVALEAAVTQDRAAALIAASWHVAEVFTGRNFYPVIAAVLTAEAGESLEVWWPRAPVPSGVTIEQLQGREWVPDAVNHRKLANTMSKLWREHRGEAMTSHRDYGLLFGLVETWPEGWQVRIFEHTLRCWSAFCAMAKLEIHTTTAFAGHDPFAPDLLSDPLFETARRCHGVPLDAGRRFRHVSLSFLRRFAHVAQELFLMDREERGLRVPPALRATSGGIYHHFG